MWGLVWFGYLRDEESIPLPRRNFRIYLFIYFFTFEKFKTQ